MRDYEVIRRLAWAIYVSIDWNKFDQLTGGKGGVLNRSLMRIMRDYSGQKFNSGKAHTLDKQTNFMKNEVKKTRLNIENELLNDSDDNKNIVLQKGIN